MPTVPIVPAVGFYRDPDLHWSSQDVLNMLPTRAERPGTRTPYILRGCPGMKPWRRLRMGGQPVGRGRGLRNVEGKLFSVVGTGLYQVTDNGGFIPRGTIPGVRRVSMAHNQRGTGNQLAIVNGYAGYVYDTSSLTTVKITDEGFPGGLVAFFVDQYIGYVDPTGKYWGHSDVSDALSYNTFDTYEAEGLPDGIVTAIDSHREVLVFGKSSIEPYVNSPSGDGTAPFVRANNTVIEIGCAATFGVCKVAGNVVLLDDKRSVQVLNGYAPVPLSTSAIEQAFAECTPEEISQAYTFAWEPHGYRVFYITVPGKFTFGYDFVNKEWHRRASNGLDYWAVSDVAYWNGRWIAQDIRNGDLYELDFKYPREACDELVREYDSASLHGDGAWVSVGEINVLTSTGAPTVECIDWQVQPDGPAISGDAPDTTTGVVYSFEYTTTPGDSPIVRVEVVSGALPGGLTLSNTGELTGSVTDAIPTGETVDYTYTVRVTDANGLWAEVPDTISVVGGMIIDPEAVEWRFIVVSKSDGTDYSPVEYDDSAWLTGGAPFGDISHVPSVGVAAHAFEPRFSPTIVTNTGQGDVRIWARYTLNLASARTTDVRLKGAKDGLFKVYLNGSLLFSVDGTPLGGYVDELLADVAFDAGENVIAVMGDDYYTGDPSTNALYFNVLMEEE